MTGTGYAITRTREADKQVLRLDKPVRARVVEAVTGLADDPRPPGCEPVKTQPGAFRVRVGKIRIVYEVDDHARGHGHLGRLPRRGLPPAVAGRSHVAEVEPAGLVSCAPLGGGPASQAENPSQRQLAGAGGSGPGAMQESGR